MWHMLGLCCCVEEWKGCAFRLCCGNSRPGDLPANAMGFNLKGVGCVRILG